jgi:formylglycine-generating enzyme required for sulfatase activity
VDTKYHFGNKDEDLPEYGWFEKNSGGRTHKVGELKPNGFGLYDMHGNVREWTVEMLLNAMTGAAERVPRGGHWNISAGYCAVSARYRIGPAARSHYIGLRLARGPSGEAPAGK